MLRKPYNNFVGPSSRNSEIILSGTEAKNIYLEAVKEVSYSDGSNICDVPINKVKTKRKRKIIYNELLSDKMLFQHIQNNNVATLKLILEMDPSRINTVDEFGWSLLMIACQANSIDVVKELLKHNIDISIRDKAGNSARSLVIKNKNVKLADILLNYKSNDNLRNCNESFKKKLKSKEEYKCKICENGIYADKQEHLSSTIHNINASRGKKIPSHYIIPESNKGYQLMLKVGWDKEEGLGPDGSGNRYPIKTVVKNDKKGLGLKSKAKEIVQESSKNINKKLLNKAYNDNRQIEINFRRQFY